MGRRRSGCVSGGRTPAAAFSGKSFAASHGYAATSLLLHCTVAATTDRSGVVGRGREAAEDGRLSLRGPDHMSRWST